MRRLSEREWGRRSKRFLVSTIFEYGKSLGERTDHQETSDRTLHVGLSIEVRSGDHACYVIQGLPKVLPLCISHLERVRAIANRV